MSWPQFLAAPRLRQGVQSLALALLMTVITIASVKVFGWKWRTRAVSRAASGSARAPNRDLSHDQRSIAVEPEPEERRPSAASLATADLGRKLSADEMWSAAQQARARGDDEEAGRFARQIEEVFPNSQPGINAHLLLGLLSLRRGQSELALREYVTFRRIGSPEAKAEAYWGQAQALRALGRVEDERTVLQELVFDYPRSAYIAAARARLNELTLDASVH